MTWWLLAGGVALVAVTLADVLATAVSVSSGAGPVTGAVTDGLWRVAGPLRRQGAERTIRLMGTLAVIAVLLTWVTMLWAGWSAILAADPSAVVDPHSRRPTGGWGRVYFAGYSIVTLGNGDLAPHGAPWRLATVAAAGSGLFVFTLGITYVLGVVTAATEKRRTALELWTLGASGDEVIIRSWDGTGLGELEQRLIAALSSLAMLAQHHLTYPVLHQFETADRRTAIGPNIAMLDELVTLNRRALPPDVAVPASTLDAVDEVIDAYLKTLPRTTPQPDELPTLPTLERLREHGVPTVDEPSYRSAGEPRRRRMAVFGQLLRQVGWDWLEAERFRVDRHHGDG